MDNRGSDPMDRYIRKIEKKQKRRKAAMMAVFCVSIAVIASSTGFFLGRVTGVVEQETENSVVASAVPEPGKNESDTARKTAQARPQEEIRNIDLVYVNYDEEYKRMTELIEEKTGKKMPKKDYPEQEKPYSGEVVYYDTSYSNYESSEMIVSPPGSKDVLVELRDTIVGKLIMQIYIRAGDPRRVCVPAVKARVRFWCGEKWYGLEHYFSGESSDSTSKDDEKIADFQNGNIKYVITYIDKGK